MHKTLKIHAVHSVFQHERIFHHTPAGLPYDARKRMIDRRLDYDAVTFLCHRMNRHGDGIEHAVAVGYPVTFDLP